MSKFKERLGALVKGEGLTSGTITAIVIAIVIALNIVFYALGVILYTPDTADNLEISGTTDRLFSEERVGDKTVTITFCMARDEIVSGTGNTAMKGRYVLSTAEQLAERYDFVSMRFLNIITKQSVSADDSSDIQYVDIDRYRQTDALGKEIPLLKTSVIFECGDEVKIFTDTYTSEGYSDFFTLDTSGNIMAYNGEEVMASMIGWVLEDEHKTAYFTTYHGEVADISFRTMLICSGYNVEMINLKEKEVPDDADVLLISNPKSDFERAAVGSNIRTEIERMRTYLERGGSLYVALDPYAGRFPVLESFLSEYGIKISSAEREGKHYRNIVRDTDNAITADFFTLVADLADSPLAGGVSEELRKYKQSGILVSSCAALELSGDAQPLLLSSPSSSTFAGGEVTSDKGSFCLSAISYAKDADGAEAGRVMVIPSIYLTAGDALVSGGYANRDFLYAVLDTVFNSPNVPYGCNTVFYTSETLESLTMQTARIFTAIIMIIPVAVGAVGVFVIVRRKNR